VNTAFKHYPIVLCAPGHPVKARWISNGSGVNLRADKPPMWREVGTPVWFFVGDKQEVFGTNVEKIDGPRYDDGYLPVVGVGYSAGDTRYDQEVFAPVREDLVAFGAVCVRFTARKAAGRVQVRIGAPGTAKDGAIVDKMDRTISRFGRGWTWDTGKQTLSATLNRDESADLVTFTKPADAAIKPVDHNTERKACIETWTKLVGTGTRVEIPEPIVQNAWRALVVGNYLMAVDDKMNYSAGNAYDHLYEGECGDAVRSLMLFGHEADARKMVGPLLRFDRKATRFHVAGHKLQLLTHYFWVTRDKDYIRDNRALWEPVVAFIRASRKTDNGLLPKDNFAGDVAQQIYSLNSNANCWRGLRDMAAVLEDLGEREAASGIRKDAEEFRKVILEALTKSIRKDTKPPFIPLSLLSDEPAHDPLTATRIGSYYDLMIPYVLGSGILGDERDSWVIDYLRAHGGLAMGMIRSMPHQGEFDKQPGVNVLYGLRFNLTLLRRGDRDHALVGFYGHLAQAMTRDTFIGGEGSRFFHGDKFGRSFYLPPNSASNATFLTTMRYLLIQDWDLDDDGKPETLRLLDAIPPRWLKDGAKIVVDKAPSAFGDVSMSTESRLKEGEVRVSLKTPSRPIGKWTLRLPDPPGYRVTGARIGDKDLRRDADGRVDLSRQTGEFVVRFAVAQR
jgi:hypothetical protein